ncbi:azurin [Aerolutibacter ruishenii]|uniref:Azurin n=1 Tax=Aerolutibacter ruishenii TaxID=686800 RepID=A0A562LHV3_9GAMM|nr:azurin [Lysobacter ruishenii]TWI07219.1 azurin [Lysobacter ruishenii]
MFRYALPGCLLLGGLAFAPQAFAQSGCTATIDANDAMRYNVASLDIPRTCQTFTVTLKHVGKMPKAAMGHNIVIAKSSDMAGIDADGIKAGVANDYLKANDARVIAHSKLIGGGESTTVKIPVAKLAAGGPYSFFCSFPGHSTLMKGTINLR